RCRYFGRFRGNSGHRAIGRNWWKMTQSGHRPHTPFCRLPRPLRCFLQPGGSMRRRQLFGLLGAAALWPVSIRAQQKLPTIGFLGASSPAAWGSLVAAFERRLRELGWIDGRTVSIVYSWAEGRSDRYDEIAAEFVHRKVDVIVTSGGAGLAVKRATTTIPTV